MVSSRGGVATRADADWVADLVHRAASGDRTAWESLVDQYVGLIWAISRSYGLRESDAADVTQTTWLRLLEHIDRLHDPARVGAWLATTARRECLRLLAGARRLVPLGSDEMGALDRPDVDQPEVDARLLAEESAVEVHEAMSHLPPHWRELLETLMAEPSRSYEDVSQTLGIPVGSIGPTRGRCLRRLRTIMEP